MGASPPPASYVIAAHQFEAPALKPGLYLVATPIGNLGDVTLRALATLAAADVILCEDTRVTHKLLERYGIRTRTLAYHEHNAAKMEAGIVERLQAGAAIALVSDAGMPLVSDPGERLVGPCVAAGVSVTILPGASAPLAALSLSALPVLPFTFLGFLPAKTGERRRLLERYLSLPATLIFFESPHRVSETLKEIATLAADRPLAIGRELTKLFEEVVRGPASQLAAAFAEREVKGEVTICIGPASDVAPAISEQDLHAAIDQNLQAHGAAKTASLLAKQFNIPRKSVYDLILARKG